MKTSATTFNSSNEEPVKLKGYLYLRDHRSYHCEMYDVYKMGSTKIILNRAVAYRTCEVEPGSFIMVIEILNKKAKKVEKYLQHIFKEKGYHRYFGAGTEFFDTSILPIIQNELDMKHIEYRILSKEELDALNYKKYEEESELSDSTSSLSQKSSESGRESNSSSEKEGSSHSLLSPLPHQEVVLEKIEEYYQEHRIGQIRWACGLGKALLSLMISQKMGFKSVVIGVPSIYLQKQMKKEILRVFPGNRNIYYIGGSDKLSFKKSILKESDPSDSESDVYSHWIQREIIRKLDNRREEAVLFFITTYRSCYLLAHPKMRFDFKIGDEAHHLATVRSGSDKIYQRYNAFHNIQSNYALYMSATPKSLEEKEEADQIIYSMDDERHFGAVIDKKSISWGIENKKITDYYLNVLYNSEDEVDLIIRDLDIHVSNKELFISAYMTLKAMEKYDDLTHILIYCNSTTNARIVNDYIHMIMEKGVININCGFDELDKLYINDLHSRKSHVSLDCRKERGNCECEICKFSKAKCGIISSVYIFGEGFDLPRLNGVTFAENMSSEIRIVQSALRPNRMDRNYPEKKAYMILPYIDDKDLHMLGKNSFEKCRKIIYEMRNQDEAIEQKIGVFKLNVPTPNPGKEPKSRDYIHISLSDNCEDKLNTFKMRLRHSKALPSKSTPEEDEYQMVRAINRELNVNSISDYHAKRDAHIEYVEDPEKYFMEHGVWRGWYDFMGIDTSKYLQNKEEWVQFCKKMNIQNSVEYYEKCKVYEELPTHPELLYIDFTSINALLLDSNRRRFVR